MELNVKAFGVACGVVWGLGLFGLTWWMIYLGPQGVEASALFRLYPGYTVTPLGSIVGLAWGFLDALIGGVVLAWIYNKLLTKV